MDVPPGWDEWHAAIAGGNYFRTKLFANGQENLYTGIY